MLFTKTELYYVFKLLLICFLLSTEAQTAHAAQNDGIRQYLQKTVEALSIDQKNFCRNEQFCGSQIIIQFYERRNFEPAWQHDGRPLHQAYALLEILKQSENEGLNPSDYHVVTLQEILDNVKQVSISRTMETHPVQEVNLDLLMTDAFFLYAAHLLSGRIDPETIYPAWEAFSPKADLAQILEDAIQLDTISGTLNQLAPPHPEYQQLKAALKRYQKIAEKGGWPTLMIRIPLRPGDNSPDVSRLRQRLCSSAQQLSLPPAEANQFDEMLAQQVRHFQMTHGLSVDGVVGPRTLRALNVTIEQRLRQIELNLERWRWLPRHLGERHIRVNIADYSLTAVENATPDFRMRIVAGKPFWQTPVFSRQMRYLVINPYWNIPHKIAVNEILPELQKDKTYLNRQNIKIFDSWEKEAVELNPVDIDWSEMDVYQFKYRLCQTPGPLNPLGRLKFIFPNKYAIYLHDTPTKHLFKRNSRSFSHGCIRLEKPVKLANWILKDEPHWTYQNLLNVIKSSDRKVIPIHKPLDVHILYWTAWVDEKGDLHFRKDIYERDPPLDRALRTKRAEHNHHRKTLYLTNTEPVLYLHE
jgi:murein L,D-transpeptidase YcbB/YkuD